MDILLKGLRWVEDSELRSGTLLIRKGKIYHGDANHVLRKNERVLSFDRHFLYPGLINAHDHLEMNFYPLMGKPPYQNYTQWAKDVYRPQASPVKEIESTSLKDRLLWGGIKNLISGVTTVVHHNPWHRTLGSRQFPVRVLSKYSMAHSLAFEKNIMKNFPSGKKKPFMIHIAEGVDEFARDEIRKLHDLGALKANTILIHCVGLNPGDIDMIAGAGASVVWCPSSNLFMFNQTADIQSLKQRVAVMLGSDSTMTGPATLLKEMKVAVRTGMVSAKEVFDMVTSIPAKAFNLPDHGIHEGSDADLFILPILNDDYFENLIHPETAPVSAVFVGGEFRFGDASISQTLEDRLYKFKIGPSEKAIHPALERIVKNPKYLSLLQSNSVWQDLHPTQ